MDLNKKIFLGFSISVLGLASTLTGCNVKFIEKAPPKEPPKEETSNLGDIDIGTEDTDHMEIETSESVVNPFEPEDSSEEPVETETETSTLGENQKEVEGIIFDMEKKDIYVAETTKAYPSPSLRGSGSSTLSKGSRLTLLGISKDKAVSMVKVANGSIYFMDRSKLSETPVSYDPPPTEPPEIEESQSSENNEIIPPSENQNTETITPVNPSTPPAPTTPPSPPKPPEPPKVQGGIDYPRNPSSTSINFGVTFADESFAATVVNKTTMNSGPGRVLPSTGYEVIETFEKGTTVNCTGIGQNGYVRVVLADGTQGFILNSDLKR